SLISGTTAPRLLTRSASNAAAGNSAIAPAQLGPMVDQNPSHLTWCQAALQAKQRHPQFDQMIKLVTDPIAPPTAELRLANGHPELPQITQLVDQQGGRRLATRQRPRHLTMRHAEFRAAIISLQEARAIAARRPGR